MANTATKTITADVSRPNGGTVVTAKQFDKNSRFLIVKITNGRETVYPPSGATVTINARRPDRETQSFACEINDDGTITAPITYWMLEVPGTVSCDISIFGDETQLTTTVFNIAVQQATTDDTTITEDENYSILLELIEECRAAISGDDTYLLVDDVASDSEVSEYLDEVWGDSNGV